MGREVKRVPLDFDWPMGTIWQGFLNPHYSQCQACKDKEDYKTPCKWCGDKGTDPVTQEAYKAWEPTEPPTGEGWQMWETTSEGSAISPVFETSKSLARWLANTNASSFGHQGATYEQWYNVIHAGWAPSAMVEVGSSGRGRLISGAEAVAHHGLTGE